MIRPTTAHVDLGAIARNYRALATYLASEQPTHPPRLIAVVKANAYGHGPSQVARALEAAGADLLACADIEEGAALRAAGVTAGHPRLRRAERQRPRRPVRLPPHADDFDARRGARRPGGGGRARGAGSAYHLKIDTGMNRLGFRDDNLPRTLPGLLGSPNLELDAVYTHFATADDPDSRSSTSSGGASSGRCGAVAGSSAARPRYCATPPTAPPCCATRASGRPRPARACCSTGSCRRRSATTLPLEPAMTLTSRIVAVKGVRAGEAVGYGARFRAERPATMAIVPAGYADGLDLRLAGRGTVLVRGRRVPIVGAVSMDMLTIDVTGLDVEPGDQVVIIGDAG